MGDYGNPIDWHYNPKKNVSWPKDIHWSKVMKFEKVCGDIKLTWEVNRFPHLYYLVRAYIITKNSKYVKAFLEQLKHWETSNLYDYGVNWFSGQELAIRVLSWIYALYMMGDDNNFKEDDFQRLLKLIYLHALHIEKNISYAYYAVYNNHLIGEALALYIVGTLFPYFSESIRWKKRGKAILESEKCLGQFYKDGGYCQLSFNYQRLALHYYLWALRIAELNGDSFNEEIFDIMDRSAKFLYSFVNLEDGRLPNWGSNDGALLNPWTSCDYSDYRPLINSLSYITRKKRAFQGGPWDEELFWFFGKDSLNSDFEPYELKSRSFQITGLHVLRANEGTFATLRCGDIFDRFGQADELHTDVWWKGLNIAIDGGSYLYNDELQYHKYFMGTSSHNTVVVNGEDQMLLFRRFKWLYLTKAKLLNFSEKYVIGEHYGYKRLNEGIIHRREVQIINSEEFLILDQLTQKKNVFVNYDLHWLLNDFEFRIEQIDRNISKVTLFTPKGKYYIFFSSDIGCKLVINRAVEDNKNPDGWQSRYYGEKIPALSLHFICSSKKGVKFFTFFTAKEKNYFHLKEVIGGENAFALDP
ncbi:MAG: alginate lyase family protein [Caldisericum sp.]|uniref:alginate lyase family protein n=1 Tax=Caldisericum sp. TaxID=2499687 RepID=UPI003D09FEA1